VEERKRLICEAERERREAILRKNQEREARIEAKKKNERSHIVFAFGSSTPRMLEPADTGGSSFWGTRRATSTTNVMMFSAAQPLTRRSSERELDGSKKRATSAGGLDRKPGEGQLTLRYLPSIASIASRVRPSSSIEDGHWPPYLARRSLHHARGNPINSFSSRARAAFARMISGESERTSNIPGPPLRYLNVQRDSMRLRAAYFEIRDDFCFRFRTCLLSSYVQYDFCCFLWDARNRE